MPGAGREVVVMSPPYRRCLACSSTQGGHAHGRPCEAETAARAAARPRPRVRRRLQRALWLERHGYRRPRQARDALPVEFGLTLANAGAGLGCRLENAEYPVCARRVPGTRPSGTIVNAS